MKKIFLLLLICLIRIIPMNAQTTAMDFTQADCNGQIHNLFSELDSGYVVVIEFIMTCPSCIFAGHFLENIIAQEDVLHPDKIRFYQFAYSPSYDCSTMTAFRDTNGFNSCTFEENGHLMNYYGGFGMPTIAVVAGTNHDVLYSKVSFDITDTLPIKNSIDNYFSTLSVNNLPSSVESVLSFPNPVSDFYTVKINLKNNALIKTSLHTLSGLLICDEYNGIVNSKCFENKIDVSALSAGYYLLKIKIDEDVFVEKINVVH